MDYPSTYFRVLLLDDGASKVLRDAVASLRSQWPHLSYHSRGQQSGRVFAKAGNLNYALFDLQVEFQPEFHAVLDADCIPKPEFLRATLPHLLKDPQAALLTTRQYYYNLPDGDPLQQSRLHFYTCHNYELDRIASAIDAGSGAVFRRKAIVEVGGYPTFSFSEDWQLSLILQGLGYRTFQVLEPLQFGLVPTSLDGHIAQRNRWQLGHSQQPSVLFSDVNKSIPRRLQWSITFNGVLIIFGLAGYMVGFAAVPILFASGNLIPATSPFTVKIQVILSVSHIALTWMHGIVQAAHTGFRIAPFAFLENSWLAGSKYFTRHFLKQYPSNNYPPSPYPFHHSIPLHFEETKRFFCHWQQRKSMEPHDGTSTIQKAIQRLNRQWASLQPHSFRCDLGRICIRILWRTGPGRYR